MVSDLCLEEHISTLLSANHLLDISKANSFAITSNARCYLTIDRKPDVALAGIGIWSSIQVRSRCAGILVDD